MAAIFSFRCRTCGKLHEGSPSFGFDAPAPYLEQSPQSREAGHLGSDTCWYEDADGRHHFIRTCLEVPIHGVSEPFLWGVWVSLSQRSFERYTETYDSPDTADCYFGWLCNYLPCYERTYALKTRVHPRAGGERPWIELERSDHPLCVDYHRGISVSRAQEIAEAVAHR
jgi:hypothetical protein